MHGQDRKLGCTRQIRFELCLQNLAGALLDRYTNCRASCAVLLPSEGPTKRRPSPLLLEQMHEKKAKMHEKTSKIAALMKDCNELKEAEGIQT